MSSGSQATVFVPATVANIGPGFDVLGLAVEGLGDRVTVELVAGPSRVGRITGRDAASVPTDPTKNCAVVAAESILHRIGETRGVLLSLDRMLPLSGGLGSSAAASVGGAMAAVLASGKNVGTELILAAALDGEESVAGRHLDNIAPCVLGGVSVVLGTDPPSASRVPVKGEWWVAVVSPDMKLATKKARAVLPELVTRQDFVAQMAHSCSLVTAFASGDFDLARRALVDVYAEPRRAGLIPGFSAVKAAALKAGALGCSISGAGPTIFALAASQDDAKAAAEAMRLAFAPMAATTHVGRVAQRGAHPL